MCGIQHPGLGGLDASSQRRAVLSQLSNALLASPVREMDVSSLSSPCILPPSRVTLMGGACLSAMAHTRLTALVSTSARTHTAVPTLVL
jgi:hypothetical protein